MRCLRTGRSHVHHRYGLYQKRKLSPPTAFAALTNIQLTGNLSALSLSLDLPVDVGKEAFSASVSVRLDDDEADDDCEDEEEVLPSLPRDGRLGLSSSFSTMVWTEGCIEILIGLIMSSTR